MTRRRLADLAAGILLAVLGGYVLAAASAFSRLSTGYPGPGLFPQVLGVILALLGLSLLLARPLEETEERVVLTREGLANAVSVVAAVLVYMAAVNRLGFILTAGLLLVGLMVKLGAGAGRSVVFGFGLSGILYVLFARLLRVPLPGGPLG